VLILGGRELLVSEVPLCSVTACRVYSVAEGVMDRPTEGEKLGGILPSFGVIGTWGGARRVEGLRP